MISEFRISNILLAIGFLALSACSGGGSGGSDSGDNGDDDSLRVTNKPAVRIIHSSIDAVPVGITSNGVFLGESSYLGKNKFYNLGLGSNLITLTRSARASEPLRSLNLNVADKEEYTVFVYGAQRDENFNVKILPEPIVKPLDGMSRFQVLNGLSDASSIKFSISTTQNKVVPFGNTSGFLDIPSGVYDVSVVAANGAALGVTSVNLSEKIEITLVVSGKLEYSFVSMKTYQDLD
jgi:hypothetical protein